MAVGCGAKFAKIMLIVFNIIFLCSGIVLMALGIWLLVTLAQQWGPSQIFKLASDSALYRNSAILLIAMGCFILFITIFGLVAAIRESVILLSIYAVLLFLIFAGEIAGGVVAIVYKDDVLDAINRTLEKSLQFNETAHNPYYIAVNASNQCQSSSTGRLWDYVQIWLECCGIRDQINSGYSNPITQCNVTKNYFKSNADLTRPLTCCKYNGTISKFDADHQEDSIYANNFNCAVRLTEDCESKIKAWVVRFAPILIGIGIGFGMLELFGFIFVICLCMNTEKGFKRF